MLGVKNDQKDVENEVDRHVNEHKKDISNKRKECFSRPIPWSLLRTDRGSNANLWGKKLLDRINNMESRHS